MSKITILQKGITNIETEAIVNAANDGLWEGGGVCGAIFRAAGSSKLAQACHKLGDHCDTGSAVITPGFDLCPYIIHAVGPVYRDGKHHEPQLLYGCYKASLSLCKENDIHSVGFPLISAGIFGYPVDAAWRKALQACQDFIESNPDYDIDIRFAIPSDANYKIGMNTLATLVSHTDTSNSSAGKEDNSKKFSINYDKFVLKHFESDDITQIYTDLMNGVPRGGQNFIKIAKIDLGTEKLDQLLHYFNDNYDKLIITDFSASECVAYIRFIYSWARFTDDLVDDMFADGTMMKVLFRLQDLKIKSDKN